MDWLSSILDEVPAVRAIVGTLLVFFVPGFAWTLVLFKQIQKLERVALSFALSIAFVSLSIVFTNIVFHIRITGLNSLMTIIIITVIPLAIRYRGRIMGNKRDIPVKN